MRRTVILSVLIIVSISLFGQINPREVFLDYYREPSMENFLKAYSYFSIAAERDTLPDRAILNLMNIHKMEYDKHLDYLLSNVGTYRSGMKFQVANTLMGIGQYEKAIELYEEVNTSAPDWSRPWRRKGEAHLRLKEYSKAETALKRAIETREINYDAYLMLSEVYLLQKKNRLALQTIEKAFEIQGTDPDDREETYTERETDLLYLRILQANRDRRARELEEKLMMDN